MTDRSFSTLPNESHESDEMMMTPLISSLNSSFSIGTDSSISSPIAISLDTEREQEESFPLFSNENSLEGISDNHYSSSSSSSSSGRNNLDLGFQSKLKNNRNITNHLSMQNYQNHMNLHVPNGNRSVSVGGTRSNRRFSSNLTSLGNAIASNRPVSNDTEESDSEDAFFSCAEDDDYSETELRSSSNGLYSTISISNPSSSSLVSGSNSFSKKRKSLSFMVSPVHSTLQGGTSRENPLQSSIH